MASTSLPCAFDAAHGAPGRLAVATGDSRLQVYDVRSGERLFQLTQPDHLSVTYTCLALSPAADADAEEGPKRKKKRGAKKAAAAQKRLAAVGTKSGVVVVWDVAAGEVLHRLGAGSSDGHGQAVNDVVFSPCGRRVYSCSDDRRVIGWDAATGEAVASFRAGKRAVQRVAVSPDGKTLLTAGSAIKLWDLATEQVLQKYAGHASPVGCLSFSPDGKVFVSGAADRYLHVWDAELRGKAARQPAGVLALDCPPVSARVASPAAASAEYTVVSVSEAGTAGVWRWARGASAAAGDGDDEAGKSRAPACRVTVQVVAGKQAGAGRSRATVRATAQDGAIVEAQVLGEDRVLLVRGSGIRPSFEELVLADPKRPESGAMRPHVELPSLSARLFEAGAAGRKRKAASGEVHVVGAEQAGAGSVRLARQAAMVAGPEEAARAAKAAVPANGLAEASPEEVAAAVAAGATPVAGSLQVVLSQALKTGDEGMIEQCIGTHSVDVIRRTVDRLPTRDIVPFLRRLVAKFQTKPNRGPHLLMWIQEILTRHCSYLTSVPGLAHELSGLFQTVDTRLAVFSKLLNLSGRLDLMLSQINVRKAAAAESTEAAGPLATYEEGDDSDDEEDDEEEDDEEEDDDDEDEEDDDEDMSD